MVKYGKYSPAKFANFVYICITRGKSYHFRGNFSSKMVTFSARNTNVYKICKLCRAIFFIFYNISPPNFATLLILTSSFIAVVKDFVLPAQFDLWSIMQIVHCYQDADIWMRSHRLRQLVVDRSVASCQRSKLILKTCHVSLSQVVLTSRNKM